MLTTKYGRLIDGAVQYAPMPLMIDDKPVFTNREALYLAHGYKRIVNTPRPDEVEGFTLTSEWVETEDSIELVWTQVEDARDIEEESVIKL